MNPLIVQQFIDWLGSDFAFETCHTTGTTCTKFL
jgi:hypothetical protein